MPASSSFILKSFLSPLRIAVAGFLFSAALSAHGQGARFFRIVGPTSATITAFHPDGSIIWSNAQPGSTYTVQTVSSLPGGTNWEDYVQLAVTNAVNTNKLVDFNPPAGMAFIPAGSFTMGNAIGDTDITDAAPVTVIVSAFYMDANLVSLSQWLSVYSYATNHGYSFDDAGAGKGADHPVQTVNWYDCVKWCNARSQQAGKVPVYYTDAAMSQVCTNGDTDEVYVNWAAQGFRLPTEAEWEKAARGGLIGQRFPWGDVISESLANYSGDTTDFSYDLGPNGFNSAFDTGGFPYTSPVGSFAPNGYRLYDMSGNVFEWCWDWYGVRYAGGADPRGPASPDPQYGSIRVLRGGNWYGHAKPCRSAYRGSKVPASYDDGDGNGFGFRSVLPSGQ